MKIRNKSGKTLLAGVMDTMEMDWDDRTDGQPIQKSGDVETMEGQDVNPRDFCNKVEHTAQVHVESEMDIALFIKLTARSALEMVKDPEGSGRTTERVKILLELLNQETKGVYKGPVVAVDCQP